MEATSQPRSSFWISCWGFWTWNNCSDSSCDNPVDNNEKLVGAVGGIDENVSAENLSDVECKEDDPLFEFNENVTIP